MGFMACSRRLDQTGMYLKNEYSVFKGHPDFRPYKVSLTRILRFRVGLVGALWLSLQDYIWFVLIFSVSYAVGLGQKKYLVGFPTRHRRRFYLIRLHIMHPKICFTKFACFFSRSLKLIILSVGSYTGHIVHGHSSGSFDAGVDCSGVQCKTAESADAEHPDLVVVDALEVRQIIDSCGEIFRTDVRRS